MCLEPSLSCWRSLLAKHCARVEVEGGRRRDALGESLAWKAWALRFLSVWARLASHEERKNGQMEILAQRETVMFSEAELLSCLTHLEAENKLMWRDGMATYVGSG